MKKEKREKTLEEESNGTTKEERKEAVARKA